MPAPRHVTAADPGSGQRRLRVERLGRVPYADGLDLQARLVAERRAGTADDTLLLLEHPHVITLGTSADRGNILVDEGEARLLGIDIFETGRGGDVTYHGPSRTVAICTATYAIWSSS